MNTYTNSTEPKWEDLSALALLASVMILKFPHLSFCVICMFVHLWHTDFITHVTYALRIRGVARGVLRELKLTPEN